MTYRNVLLAAHILFAIVLVGPLVVGAVTAASIVRLGGDALPVARWSARIEETLGKLSALVLVTGLLLVARADAYDFGQAWVVASIALFVVASVNGAVGLGGTMKAAIAKLESGRPADAEAGRLQLLSAVACALLVALVWLMVAKPGL